MNQVRLVKMGMEEAGLVVVGVAWVVGERRGRVGSVGGRSRLGTGDVDVDADADRDTPGLSAPGASSSETSSDSSSDVTSPSPPPQQIPVEPETPALPPPPPHSQTKSAKPKSYVPKDNNVNRNESNCKALTRRQRKALGLPKSRLPQQRSSSSAMFPDANLDYVLIFILI